MPKSQRIDQIIQEVRVALEDLYGKRLVHLVLYGSYARGHAEEESDLDLLVVLDDFHDVGEELERMGEIGTRLSLHYDLTIAFLPVREKDYRHRLTPLLLNIRREGIPV